MASIQKQHLLLLIVGLDEADNLGQYSKTTFVTVNLIVIHIINFKFRNSKTTFVTVNHYNINVPEPKEDYSKTTFVTVNQVKQKKE